jgi:imidazolonepropionase-like amidohydrolase
MRDTLALGITTVRDAGFADAGVKVARDLGTVPGPRLRMAIGMISQTGGHADEWLPSGAQFPTSPGIPTTLVDGVDSARRAVRELVRAGADQIKIAVSGGGLSAHTDPTIRQLRDDELIEIVTEARGAGLDVMAHGHANAGVLAAVRAGVRSIEHGTHLEDDTVALMAERGTFLVPTLSAPHGVLEAADSGAALPTGAATKARELIAIHTESFRKALAAGVPIAMGTDAPVLPHGRNLEELARMVDAGMTPAQALQAATWTAARLMRLDEELGTLECGKRADLVVVRGDIETLAGLKQRVEQVWQDGVRCA